MKLCVGGVRRTGRAVDLRGRDVVVPDLLAAVRDPGSGSVVCRLPGDVHEFFGHLHPDAAPPSAHALASVARSRAITPSDASPPPPDPAAARRAVATAEADVTALRERVERVSGRLEARRALGADVADAERALGEATRALTDAETERIAAEQRLDAVTARLRERRSERERRLKCDDALRNHPTLRSRVLAERLRPRLERARNAVPDWKPGLLAAVRVARVRAPIVIEAGPFRRPAEAAACLDAPVILV